VEICATPYTPVDAHTEEALLRMALSPREDRLISVSEQKVIISQLPGLEMSCFDNDPEDIQAGTYHGNDEMAVATYDKVISWELNQRAVRTYPLPTEGYSVQFSPNGAVLAQWGSDQAGHLYEWERGGTAYTLDGCTETEGFAFTREGTYVAASLWHEIVIWQAFSGQRHVTIAEPNASSLCFLPDRSLAFVRGSREVAYYHYNGRDWYLSWIQKLPSEVRRLAAASGSNLLGCLLEDSITFLDSAKGTNCGTLHAEHHSPLESLIMIPSHRLVIAGSYYGHLIRWTRQT
jgi:hypothetical protein